jgi:hypothetical protein
LQANAAAYSSQELRVPQSGSSSDPQRRLHPQRGAAAAC